MPIFRTTCTSALLLSASITATAQADWSDYAGNAQHTALSTTPASNLAYIKWQTPVDLNQQISGGDLFIHYGSPLITDNNTVIVPVKTGATGGFKIEGLSGTNGAVKWSQTSDYILPPSGGANGWSWTPSYSPTLTSSGRMYYAGAGGSVYYMSSVDSNSPAAPTQVFITGSSNSNIYVNTPLTSDINSNIYFGFQNTGVTGPKSGLARITPGGAVTTFDVSTLGFSQVATNSAPAVTADGSSVYFAASTGNFTSGKVVKLNTSTLAFQAQSATLPSAVPNDGTASPMIGPDGHVFFGTVDGTSRGWMTQLDANLNTIGQPGGFGWDDTASIVPASMVPSYTGTSTYLLMTKYNNYKETGGLGQNKLAILDPNNYHLDNRVNSTGQMIMNEVLTILGPTPDSGPSGAVSEWCINTAVVDPATDSILAGSEDGKLYRWNLATNSFTQIITLTAGIGEAYTPTLIGPDGTVYAINNSILFAIGVPEPTSALLLTTGLTAALLRRRRK